jgi:hypothetical protein
MSQAARTEGKPPLESRKAFAALAAAWTCLVVTSETSAAPSALALPRSSNAALAAQLPVLAPRAVAWAQGMAQSAAREGIALTPPQQAMARRAGVREPERVRIVVLDEIPLPEEPLLKAAALKVGLSSSEAAGMTLGSAVFLRRGYEKDIRVLSHELRHVAQYEACGGIAGFLAVHLADLVAFGYDDSPFEVDARAHEVAALPRS